MKVLHGTWIPENTDNYIQRGSFYLWVETISAPKGKTAKNKHPRCLGENQLKEFLRTELGIKDEFLHKANGQISPKYFTLPSLKNNPLKSYELMKYTGEDIPDRFNFQQWQINCYKVPTPYIIKLLNDIHFLFLYEPPETLLGSDLLFWYQYTRSFKDIIMKDQYIPGLKYIELPRPRDKRKKKYDKVKICHLWEIVSDGYETEIEKYVSFMPQICVSGSEKSGHSQEFYSKESLLRHFSENLLSEIILNTKFTAKFHNQVSNTFIYHCLYPFYKESTTFWKTEEALEEYKKWFSWKDNLMGRKSSRQFTLCFKLEEAKSYNDDWKIRFFIESKKDPSLKINLQDYWNYSVSAKTRLEKNFGKDMEREILLNLGYAARMYSKIWDGLQTDIPTGFQLNINDAFGFLKESSWVLEDAGYKVIIPAWWTKEGRRKAKIRLKSSFKGKKTAQSMGSGLFGLDSVISYQYQLSIGNEVVSRKEWDDLVKAKTSLVKFRGEWMELDKEKMQEMLKFWELHAREKQEISVLDLLKISADEEFESDYDEVLQEVMSKLRDKSKFEVVPDIPKFQGKLREYQKRGVSWIQYLESFGLNGCLADDMGLGKTIQVIARLINEREEKKGLLPTLIIAPTSVLGNWRKEIERFSPHLKTMIHHGNKRIHKEKEFKEKGLHNDVVISSYALARKDEKILNSLEWERIILDEAQNIKNPQAAQTKAIIKLKSKYRLVLTGTPMENRLLDLWSIFNFLNHNYLGTQGNFRKTFELPIQKENDRVKTTLLKKLIEPFILRRVKTDKNIIKDLPEKVEQKIYCNLSREQASLYEAVVQDVVKQIEEKEGMERKGLILSSLMRLKQICNHPAQFLQDGSRFTQERSQKLSRLAAMMEEVIENGESLVIFSQFREICEYLEKFIKKSSHYNTYMIHGGTGRTKRQKMIEEFQDEETEPSIFILSLKAGGVGITLTKANHVFHFDRWWNPSVENQATDRTFRIGQKKNVFVHKFISIGTLEERIDQMIEDKKKLAGLIVGSDESWLSRLDNEAFKKLIQLSRNAVLD